MSSKEFINSVINAHKIVVFSKTSCPYCVSVKKLFKTLGEGFKAIELDSMSNGSEIQNELAKMTGQRTVPSVWINRKFIGGNSDTQALLQKGALAELLAEEFVIQQ